MESGVSFYCVAFNCGNSSNQGLTGKDGLPLSFHRFPVQDIALLDRWMKAVSRPGWNPSPLSYICSEHFRRDDFVNDDSSPSHRQLRPGAVPSRCMDDVLMESDVIPSLHSEESADTEDHDELEVQKIVQQPNKKQKVCKTYSRVPRTAQIEESDLSVSIPTSSVDNSDNVPQPNSANWFFNVKTMPKLLSGLKKVDFISEDEFSFFRSVFAGMNLRDMEEELKQKVNPYDFSEGIRKFAMTLHYFAPAAFQQVKKAIHFPACIMMDHWFLSTNHKPGFLEEVLSVMHQELKDKPWMKDCVLLVDNISLTKCMVYDPVIKQFIGGADLGQGQLNGDAFLATEVVVLMANGLKGHWKMPFAYFFLHQLSGSILSEIAKVGKQLLTDLGFQVMAVICDCSWEYFVMARGIANLDCENLKAVMETSAQLGGVRIIFDVESLMKMMRNLLADYGEVTVNGGTGTISWAYIEELYKLQSKQLGSIFCAVQKSGVSWRKTVINRACASQPLRESVAEAIDFAREVLQLEKFKGSEMTSKFIRQISKAYDIMNSRNVFDKGCNVPLQINNRMVWEPHLLEMVDILLDLRESSGLQVCDGRRKSTIIAFLRTIFSVVFVTSRLLSRDDYDYVLSHKYSLEPLRSFFNGLKVDSGWKQSPNALQFCEALRSFFRHSTVTSWPSVYSSVTNEHDSDDDDTFVISFGSPLQSVSASRLTGKAAVVKLFESTDHLSFLDLASNHCIIHGANFVLDTVSQKVKCEACNSALYCSEGDRPPGYVLRLLENSMTGYLCAPSSSLLKIVATAEKVFRRAVGRSRPDIRLVKNLDSLQAEVMLDLQRVQLFPGLGDHSFHHEPGFEEIHIYTLMRLIMKCYLSLRTQELRRKCIRDVLFDMSPLRLF